MARRTSELIDALRDRKDIFAVTPSCFMEDACPSVGKTKRILYEKIAQVQFQQVLLEKEREKIREELKRLSKVPKNILGMDFAAYKFFVDRVSKIPQVYAVFSVVEEGVIDLWTIVEGDLYQTEGEVIKVQNELLENFPDLSFDFMVLPKIGEELEENIPSGSIGIYLRK